MQRKLKLVDNNNELRLNTYIIHIICVSLEQLIGHDEVAYQIWAALYIVQCMRFFNEH